MREFVITTDSTVDLPKEWLEERNIPTLKLSYTIDGETYPDMEGISKKEFFDRIRRGSLPTTSQVTPGQARELFEPIIKEGKDIIHIGFSSGLSGSLNSERMAAQDLMEDYPERKILVFDSLNASLGEGVSVMRAVQLKEEGRSMEEIYNILAEERAHVNVCFTVDDLHHLQRGGRVSKTTAVVGSMINIKPLLTVTSTGELKSDGTVRGRKKALKTLVTRMEQCLDTEHFGKDRPVAIVHGDCIDDALAVQEHVKELGFENVVINDVSPSIGTHAGPGVVGLIFYGKTVK